jgi:hypothetical protein
MHACMMQKGMFFLTLDLVWSYEFEVGINLLIVTAPMLQFLIRTLYKCSNPGVVIQKRSKGYGAAPRGGSSGYPRACSECDRYRVRQCCQSMQ